MIEFRHRDQAIRLNAGDTYASVVAKSYSDTPARTVRALVAEIESGTPWREAVRKRYEKAHPWLARIVTDPARDLFFRQHPPSPGTRVLDIGAGWGQLALPLARTTEVTALEPAPEKLAFIRAAADQEKLSSRMHFIQADFLDVDFATKFDLVTCIGVLEWVPTFRPGDPQKIVAEFLQRIRALLAPGGRLVVGIENRLGLKYLMGALDDHLGVAEIAVYDHPLAAKKWADHGKKELRSFTYTRQELQELLSSAGLTDLKFFAALPDYKLPGVILPLGKEVEEYFDRGHFVTETEGYSGQTLTFQPELQSHYHSLGRLKIASNFVPSFYVVAQG